jgi:hypothetical protein
MKHYNYHKRVHAEPMSRDDYNCEYNCMQNCMHNCVQSRVVPFDEDYSEVGDLTYV